jgi:hypothetical protein
MPHHDAPFWVGFAFGAISASLMVGALLGLIPLILGQSIAQVRLGRVGFFATLGAGFVGGILLALPVSLGFSIALIIRWRRAKSAIDPAADSEA